MEHTWFINNLRNHGNYHLEYIFDVKSNIFYSGSRSKSTGNWYQIQQGEPVKVEKISLITADSKDYIQYSYLCTSEDSETLNTVSSFADSGSAKTDLGRKTIRAIRIQAKK